MSEKATSHENAASAPEAPTASEIAAKGGEARAKKLSKKEKSEIGKKGAMARWSKTKPPDQSPEVELPVAKHRGYLNLLALDVPCYVLSDGKRVIGRTSFTEMLSGIKGGGALEHYLRANSLKPFIDLELVLEQLVGFRLPEVEGLETRVMGLTADVVIDICRGLVAALDASNRQDSEHTLTNRQREIASRAGMFVAACAKTGLDALIDEATGYQYERAEDALQVKLRAYLEEEMRPWEPTFPDELWVQFGRLTNWKGAVSKRPKYWGKLVMELVYGYLDTDVAQWLKENAPAPRHGQNYHQWLSSQFGLKKLVEHIWKLVGVASTCDTMIQLRRRMAEIHGRVPIQLTLFVDPA